MRAGSSRLGAGDWVRAGLELIGDEGLAAVRIDRLARALSVTKGSFYWHFADLASYMEAVAEHWCSERELMREALEGLGELAPEQRLWSLMQLLSDRRYWRLERASREWARTNKRVRTTLARSDTWILATQREAFIDLGFSAEEAEVRASTMFFAGMGYILTGSERGGFDEDRARALLALMVA
jgi:AcrR family transcriptional regulator